MHRGGAASGRPPVSAGNRPRSNREHCTVTTDGVRVASDRTTVRCDKLWHNEVMAEPVGRREAGKQARRAALTAAAHRLFAEHGYEATTVRDIAAAAGLTERTFYRYFD